MPSPNELLPLIDRILARIEEDRSVLEGWRQTEDGQKVIQYVVQIGKYNTNVGEGKDITIGDHLDRALLEEVRDLLRSQLSSQAIEINWQQVSRLLLEQQVQRLTSNPLTHAEGIAYRTDQVYVPLGLVERKRQSRRREDVSPEEGSRLYKETEITRRFEHEEFLEQVLGRGDSPRSGGRRLAIIGEPGAGKTTLLQQMAQWISKTIDDSIVIWISLADLQGEPLENYLLGQWLQAAVQQQGKVEASPQIKNAFVAQFNQGRVRLLLDGADEMQVSSGNPLSEIERQVRVGGLLSQTRIVLTCRLNLWDGNRNALDTFDTYRTLEFSYPQQVEQFVGQWFGALPEEQEKQAERLCAALKTSGKERIRDLVKNPLRLSLLCFNWYLGEGALPETKAGLYEQFVADFYEWKREQFPTTAAQQRQLNTALGELAREAIDKEETRFRLRQDFVCQFLGEPDEEGSLFQFALSLGWLNKIGVGEESKRAAVYAFFHPTFQEYFASLVIHEWHFFLNHIPGNPLQSDASYFVFEQQWREVFLLWLGNQYISNSQKEELLDALMNFDGELGKLDFYGFRAKLLAASSLAEFQSFSKKQEIIDWILKLSISQIETFNNPTANSARNLLKEIPCSVLAEALAVLLRCENVHLQHDAAKLVGELKCSDSRVVNALEHLVLTTEFKDTRCDALCSLLEIDSTNAIAIDGLIQILYSQGIDATLAISAAQALRYAETQKERVIQNLENFIQPQFPENINVLLPPQLELID